MKKILYTTTAFVLCGGIVQANAACIATPSCTTLGYTSTTSCTGGLKCPFGNYWNCTHINKITELTNKITELEKTIETIKQESANSTCKIGSILFSDKTCGDDVQYGKTPIGIVVYLGGSGGQALALNSIGSYAWGGEGTDISGLPNYTSDSTAATDLASCENSKIIMAAGDKSTYPAVWATNEYSTEGTSAGDWCLPASGIWTSYYNNKTTIDTVYEKVGETAPSNYAWSSTEHHRLYTWYYYSNYNRGLGSNSKSYGYEVRPVLEF